MRKKRVRGRREIRFNLDIYRFNGDKEIKLRNIPLDYLDEVFENIRKKYR